MKAMGAFCYYGSSLPLPLPVCVWFFQVGEETGQEESRRRGKRSEQGEEDS